MGEHLPFDDVVVSQYRLWAQRAEPNIMIVEGGEEHFVANVHVSLRLNAVGRDLLVPVRTLLQIMHGFLKLHEDTWGDNIAPARSKDWFLFGACVIQDGLLAPPCQRHDARDSLAILAPLAQELWFTCRHLDELFTHPADLRTEGPTATTMASRTVFE